MRILITGILLTGLALAIPACAPAGEADDRPGVVVTILPQADFVKNVGGDRVKVTVMVPPGASPHTYEPKPAQIKALAEAKMYAKVGSGVEFELVWMDKLMATNRDMLVVDCSKGVELQEAVDGHESEAEEARPHTRLDPHIWMSPLNARIMVQNIRDGLVAVDPANRHSYEQNCAAYLEELAGIDREMRDGLSGVRNQRFMVYHPAFGYFAREYELDMIPIETEGKEPTAASLARLIEQAKAQGITVIFVEPQFDPKSAGVIAEAIGGRVVFIDPLAEDYIGNLRLILSQMLQTMQ